jgi:hypothetical protein
MARRPGGPAVWTLRVDGHLDDHWSTWFSGLALTLESDGTTRLTGLVADQAAVHGLLAKIRDLGLTLVSAETADGAADRVDGVEGADGADGAGRAGGVDGAGRVAQEERVGQAAGAGATRRDAAASSTDEGTAARGAYPQRASSQPH